MLYKKPFRREVPSLAAAGFVLAAAVVAAFPARGADLALPSGTYHVVGQARHDYYTLTTALAAPAGKPAFTTVDVVFALAGPTSYARFRWDAQGFSLERTTGDTTAVLRSGKTPLPPALGRGGALEVRTRPTVVEVVGPEGRVCRVLNPGLGRGQVAVRTGAGLAEVANYSYQRVEPIAFADDFMRTEEEAADLGLWQPISGHWRLYSVMERTWANPDARIREGREPDATRSPNPFSLAGTGADGAIVMAGQAFWSDYEAGVSVRSFQSDFGLVFSARDAENCWLVRWGLHSLGLRPAPLELVERRAGKERVVAATTVTGRAEAWYRLGVRLFGDSITVLVDDVPVLQQRDAGCSGGRIGLFARGTQETYFDDVRVQTVSDLSLDDPDLLGGDAVRPLAGNWQVTAGKDGGCFTGSGERARGDAALALCALGWDAWPAQCVETTVAAEPGAVFGLAFGVAGTERHLRVLWDGDDGGRVRVYAVTDGDARKIAQAPCPRSDDGAAVLSVDARDGVLAVRFDGTLRLRLRLEAPLTGAVGLVVVGRTPATFSACRLFAEPQLDWEPPVIVERFADDPYMQGWASTRFVWLRLDPEADRSVFPQRFIHNGDFYGPFRITAPVQDRLAFFFGLDDVVPGKGYCVETRVDAEGKAGSITLSREQRTLARANFTPAPRQVLPGQQMVDEKIGARPRTPDTESYGTLELHRDGQVIWASVGGEELFCVVDPEPLTGRALGMQVPAPMDFIHVAALRAQIKDELFERAAVDWTPVGDWDVTNRFACDPRWSHMNGSSKGVAALWSKFAFEGDFTLEYYAGMRMRQEEMMEGADRMYYPRVGDINVAMAAEAGDLFSGYNLLVTAWDPMWTEMTTQFQRLGDVLASTDKELIPRGRRRYPKTRAIEVDWDPGGRPVHGAWYFVKVRRTGPRTDVWFDNVPVFSVVDPDPLVSRRLALWTQHNSIVLARAKISYRRCLKVVDSGTPLRGAPPAQAATAAPAPWLCSPSHPARSFDFEGSTQGFTPWHGDQSVEVSLEPRGEAGTALRLENLHGGGDVGVRLPVCGVDLGRDCVLEMDVAVEPGALVNLYLAFEDCPAERCFVVLTGPRDEGPNTVRLGPAEGIPADGQWRHVRWDLGDWARRRFPWRSSLRAQFVMVGMLHEGYLNAGLGGNPPGAVYRLDNVTLLSAGAQDVAVECHTEAPERLRWRTWLSREAGGMAPAGLAELTAPCAALRAESPGEWFVQGEWWDGEVPRRFASLPIRVGVPLAVARTLPAANEAWGGDRVRLVFAESAGHPHLAHSRLSIAGVEVPVNEVTASYDPAARALDVQVLYAGSAQANQAPLEVRFETSDTLAGTASVSSDGQVRTPATDLVHTWKAVLDYAADRQPPRVALSGDPARRITFNAGLGRTALLAPPDECRFSLVPGADGTPALQLANHVCGSAFNVDFGVAAFPMGRYPRLSFDYKVDEYTQCDFMFRMLGQQMTLGFTDGDDSAGLLLGVIEGVLRDGAWHRAEVDLSAMRPKATRRSFTAPGPVSSFGFGDWVYPSNAPGARVALDNLELVPAVGTAAGPLELTWEAHDLSGIKGYSYVWDTLAATEPDTTPETATAKARFEALPGGECYFHLRAGDGAGNWGPTEHYRFLVDNDPPLPAEVEPAADTTAAADRLRVRFGPSLAGLDPSGLSLTINGKAYPARPGNGGAWDAQTSEFTYDLLADWSLLRGAVPDGSAMTVSLTQMKDAAGNVMAPFAWSWKVDYAKDTQGPLPPRLWGYGHTFDNYDHFADGIGVYWRPYGGGDGTETEVIGVTLPEAGPCLQIRKTGKTGRFAAYRSLGQFSLKATPQLDFDYCLSPGTQANLLVYLNKEWHQVTMTGSDRLPAIGRIADAKADGQWRHASLDLAKMIRETFPDKEDPEIRLLGFGEWGTTTPEGSTLWLDNVALLGPACPLPLARYSAADATGIRAYRMSFSRDPREVPAGEVTPRETPLLLAAADQPGLWYIHAQAQDGAGNWGEVLHYPYLCSEPVATYSEDGIEAAGNWRVIAGQRSSQGTAYQARGSGSNHLLGVQLIMQGSCEMEITRNLAVELPAETVLEADLYIQGDQPVPVAACVRPAGGNGVLVVGERQELAPRTWHRKVALRFPAGALAKAGAAPGKNLKIRDLGLVAVPPRASRNIILIDHVKINGKLSAG